MEKLSDLADLKRMNVVYEKEKEELKELAKMLAKEEIIDEDVQSHLASLENEKRHLLEDLNNVNKDLAKV